MSKLRAPSRTGRTSATPPARKKQPAAPAISGNDRIILALFFLSGASALVYEVVWGRRLTFIFGGTAFAIATVLAAYMAGLALGSWVLGRRIDRGGHPLVIYALLEAGVAVVALALPLILSLLDGVYGLLYRTLSPGPYALSLLRFLLSFLVLLVPTALMGGTLPVLSKLLVGGPKVVGLKTGLLYGINTVGAVAGTAAAGFFLIPRLGMTAATWVAVVFNVVVALLAFVLRKRIAWVPAAEKTPPPENLQQAGGPIRATPLQRAALLVYAASGFAALTYEVAWTKVLAGALGTTTYAFSAMLTTFLLGLSLGALIMARLADRYDPARLLAWSQLAIGALALVDLPLFNLLPVLYVDAYKHWGPSWSAQVMARFALCGLTMLPATLLMGGAFPLVARLYADRPGHVGRQIGQIYAANTLGAILGSFAAGFILVPLLGRQGTILSAVAVNVLAGALLYWVLGRTLSRQALWAAGVTAAALIPLGITGARPWDRHLLTCGAYVYARDYSRIEGDLATVLRQQRILHFQEETEATVAVWQRENVRSVRINGKSDASSGYDMLTQKMLAHVPLLHHPRPNDVLVIGLASGVTLGSALAHPAVQRADCVEMLSGMRQVPAFFREHNRDCLADPRTHLIVNDGRDYLQLTGQRYDVIISEPSNPWISGIGSLFTREFFDLGARRLKPGGIFCQWVQTYQMSQRDFGSVLRTFQTTFPHVSIWMGWPGDVILLGSREPLGLDYRSLEEALRQPTITRDMEPLGIRGAGGLMQGFVGAARTAAVLAGPDSRLVTDDNLLLEFSMPRNLYQSNVEMMTLTYLASVREPLGGYVNRGGLPPDSARAVAAREERSFAGRNRGLAGIDRSWASDDVAALSLLEEAERSAPEDPVIRHFLAEALNKRGLGQIQRGQNDAAFADFRRAALVGYGNERTKALGYVSARLFELGQADSALGLWRRMSRENPEDADIRLNLGLAFEKKGDREQAVQEYRAMLERWPDNSQAMICLATLLAGSAASIEEAIQLGEKALSLDPSPGNMERHGWTLAQAGRLPEAARVLRQAAREQPERLEVRMRLAAVLQRQGKRREARFELERIVREDPNGTVGQMARQALTTI